jgi:transcriptional antiterminator NusG
VVLEPLSDDAANESPSDDSAVAVEPKDGRAWYIVQTYSGYENKVKVDLEQRIKSMDMSERIHQVVVPTEDEIEIRDGQRKTVSKKLFPGYVFVQMLMDDESWYVVRNTPGVTGFAGTTMDERAKPTPLPDTEVDQILKQMHSAAPRINIGFQVGETVLVTDGPFSEMIGTVDTIDLDRGRVRVMVSMFGRDTPVELDFLQVEKQ